jgi:cystathionine gamma-synthase/cystathionine gamma-lyase
MQIATRAIRAAQAPDPETGAVIVPIHPSVTYAFKEIGVPSAFEYSRSANPTRTVLEKCLASLEGADHGMAFSTGMAACEGVLSMLQAGDRVVSARQIYGGTHRLFESVWRPRGVEFDYVEGDDPAAFERALESGARMVWIETPTNPLLQLVDIAAAARASRAGGATLVVDNTFASPCLQRPLEHGADIVLHSTTKYIGGHSDVLGGAVLTSDAGLAEKIRFYQNAAGAVMGPFDAWLTLRGIKTLPLRMERHASNALAVAEFLETQSRVARVIYPGLDSHPQHELARRQMDGFGGIVSFEIEGGREAANQFVKRLKLFIFAESLGGVESLACHPATMSHGAMTEEERAEARIGQGLIRLSVGVEDIGDLIEDLDQALE